LSRHARARRRSLTNTQSSAFREPTRESGVCL
jgi:hypothetical protein